MYSNGKYRGVRFVRTQRSAQIRRLLMGAGALALVIGGVFTEATFAAQERVQETVAETALMATRVESNRANIAAQLAVADQLAAEVGDQVADPAVVASFAAMREQARNLAGLDIAVPTTAATTKEINLHHDVVVGIMAVDAAMVGNLQAGAEALAASHGDYEALVAARQAGWDAAQRLAVPLQNAQAVLDVTAGVVDEGLRHELGVAIQAGRDAQAAATSDEETGAAMSVDAFNAAAAACDAAQGPIAERADAVVAAIPAPEPEEGAEAAEGEPAPPADQ